MPTQPPGIGVTNVVDPALHAAIKFGEADLPAFVQIDVMLQTVGEVHRVATLETAVGWVDDKAEPWDTLIAAGDLRLAFMRGQAYRRQPFDDGVLPVEELRFVVTEQGKVVYVAQMGSASRCPSAARSDTAGRRLADGLRRHGCLC